MTAVFVEPDVFALVLVHIILSGIEFLFVRKILERRRAAIVGDAVVLTASVTGSNPAGNVEFYANGMLLGTGPLCGGVASFTSSTLPVGSHDLTATYLGNVTHTGSTTVTAQNLVVIVRSVTPAPDSKPTLQQLAATGAETPSLLVAAGPIFSIVADQPQNHKTPSRRRARYDKSAPGWMTFETRHVH